MKNDFALATQSVADWSEFTNDMIYLFQEGLSLESGITNKYTDLKICARIKPWSMESDTTKITNLAMESKWLSIQSIIEKSPDAAPDEMKRIADESASIQEQTINNDKDALKAEKTAKNNSSQINNNINKNTYSNIV